MKKLFLLIALISIGAFSQTNPSVFKNGIDTKLIALDTLTTAQRDAISVKASKGYIIFNADTDVLNVYDGSSWGAISGGSSTTPATVGEINTGTDNTKMVTPLGLAGSNIQTYANNGQTAYSWGNHAGLYKPIGYVPAWAEITGKPTLLSQFTNDVPFSTGAHSTEFSETLQYTGTRAGVDLVTTIGDYDDSGGGKKLIINNSNPDIPSEITGSFKINQGNLILFQGLGNGILSSDNITSDRDIYLPDASGTIALQEWVLAQGYGTGTGHTIQDNGVSKPARTNLNFKNFVVDDNAANNSTDITAVVAGAPLTYNYTAVGAETSINTGVSIASNYQTEIYYGNAVLSPTIDYTLSYGATTTINFTFALEAGYPIRVVYNSSSAPNAITDSDDVPEGATNKYANSNATNQGNTFNGANQLVKLDGTGKLPAIDGSNLTNLPSGSSTVDVVSNVATSTILGRTTAGSGNSEELTPTQVRTLLNVANGATANSSDATLLTRANHTGTQLSSTISDFATAVSSNSAVAANTSKVTNADHTGEVTGSTTLTVNTTAVSNKSLKSTLVGTEEVLINDAGTLKKTTTQDIAELVTLNGNAYTLKASDTWQTQQFNHTNVVQGNFLGAAVSTGTISTAIPTASLDGVNANGVFIRSSTTANGGYKIFTSSIVADYFGQSSHKFVLKYKPVTSFANVTVRAGYHDTATNTDAVDGAYFEIDGSGNVSAKTANNSTRTTATSTALTINTAYQFEIDVNKTGTSADFKITNIVTGALVYDQTITTNIPTTTARTFGSGFIATESTTTASDIGILYELGMGTIEAYDKFTSSAGNATAVGGVTVSGTPTIGQVPVATSGTTATWQTPSGGGVSDGDKGDIVVSGSGATWNLDTSGVSAGSYTNANITVDAKGRITLASNGAGASIPSPITTITQYTTKAGLPTITGSESDIYAYVTNDATRNNNGLYAIVQGQWKLIYAWDYAFIPIKRIAINWADTSSPDWVTGSTINSSGDIVVSAGKSVSNYIPVRIGDKLIRNIGWGNWAMYDSSLTLIPTTDPCYNGTNGGFFSSKSVNITHDYVKYIRWSFDTSDVGVNGQIVKAYDHVSGNAPTGWSVAHNYERDNLKYTYGQDGLISEKETNQLFNFRKAIYYEGRNEDGAANTSTVSTDFIKIKAGLPYSTSTGISAISFWDINKAFISGTSASWAIAPVSAVYMKVRIGQSDDFKNISIVQSIKPDAIKYREFIEETAINPISVCLIGDSIATEDDGLATSSAYATLMREAFGIETFHNVSVSGKSVRDFQTNLNGGRYAMPVADMYIVALGTNDFAYNRAIGTVSDNAAADTFMGGLQDIIEGVTALNANAKIVFFTPIPRITQNNVNATGNKLNDYRNAVIKKAISADINYLDLFEIGLNPFNANILSSFFISSDGTHPNNNGHKLYAYPEVVKFMQKELKRR